MIERAHCTARVAVQEVRGEARTEGVAGRALVDLRRPRRNDILDPQRRAFEPLEAACAEHFREEAGERIESFEQGLDLTAREDRPGGARVDGRAPGLPGLALPD